MTASASAGHLDRCSVGRLPMSVRDRLQKRRERRALKNIRAWFAIPDTVTDEEIVAMADRMGKAARAAGIPAARSGEKGQPGNP
jgi:hypothetical protein